MGKRTQILKKKKTQQISVSGFEVHKAGVQFRTLKLQNEEHTRQTFRLATWRDVGGIHSVCLEQ